MQILPWGVFVVYPTYFYFLTLYNKKNDREIICPILCMYDIKDECIKRSITW